MIRFSKSLIKVVFQTLIIKYDDECFMIISLIEYYINTLPLNDEEIVGVISLSS